MYATMAERGRKEKDDEAPTFRSQKSESKMRGRMLQRQTIEPKNERTSSSTGGGGAATLKLQHQHQPRMNQHHRTHHLQSYWKAITTCACLGVLFLLVSLPPSTFLDQQQIASIRGTASDKIWGPSSFTSSSDSSSPVLPWKRPQLSLSKTKKGELLGYNAVSGKRSFSCSGSSSSSTSIAASDKCWIHFPTSCDSTNICLITKKGDKDVAGTFYAAGPPLPNQDQSLLIEIPGQGHDGGGTKTNKLIALLDGHGVFGHTVSQLAIMDLPFRILEALSTSTTQPRSLEAMSDLLTQSFLAVDDGPVKKFPASGSTAIVVYQDGSELYVSSVGDSTAFVGQFHPKNSSSTIVLETIPHKPADKEERERIESLGGTVMLAPNPTLSSRVFLPMSATDKENLKIGADGTEKDDGDYAGIFGGGVVDSVALAMSRSLGDFDGKKPGYLLAEPSIRKFDMKRHAATASKSSNSFYFVVAASDGLLDMVPKGVVANAIGRALTDKVSPEMLRETCQALIDKAILGWAQGSGGMYRDDISLVVSKLEF